jgi:hypothetical protein
MTTLTAPYLAARIAPNARYGTASRMHKIPDEISFKRMIVKTIFLTSSFFFQFCKIVNKDQWCVILPVLLKQYFPMQSQPVVPGFSETRAA